MQVTIEDSASAVTTPAAMLGTTNTPVGRIRLETLWKIFDRLGPLLGVGRFSPTGPGCL
jgi:hypothetical protein